MPELGHLLYENFEMEQKPDVCKHALRRLEEIFYKSDYFRGNCDLVAVLMVSLVPLMTSFLCELTPVGW